MEVIDNVLVVDDEEDWCAIYERAARRQGVTTIRTAGNLAQATSLLESMTFSVAFVDIGLDVADDRNVDGLRVMEKIRSLGDETSIIVVTGRSGRDVLAIARDAIKKYGAFDTVSKVPIEPSDIASLLEGGREAYRKAVAAKKPETHQVLRGRLPGWDWDDQILRATRIEGGIATLYGFLDRLFGSFLPAIARQDGDNVRLDPERQIAYGDYWSRAVGRAVLICFGEEAHMRKAMEEARRAQAVLERYRVADVLKESSAGAVRGAVFALADEPRGSFHTAG
jgi:ActR/RegA family two-component response regulator